MGRTRVAALARCAAAAAALLAAPAALGQSADETAARALFRDGLALHEARDFAGAIQKYREAYALWKNPKILTNLGTAAWELGQYPDAADAYDRFLADAPPNDPKRPEVEKALREVVPRVGTLDVHVSGGGSAVLIVDGRSLDAPILDRVRVTPGAHTLEAVGAGGVRAKQAVDAPAGATVDVSLVLGAPSSEPAAPRASDTRFEAHAASPPHSALPFIVGGVGVAGLMTSGVLFILRGSAVSELEQRCLGNVCPGSSQDTIDRANTLGTAGLIALGVGVVGLGAGIYLFTTENRRTTTGSTGVEVSVGAGAGTAGAFARGRF